MESIRTVGQLIEELKAFSPNAFVGLYSPAGLHCPLSLDWACSGSANSKASAVEVSFVLTPSLSHFAVRDFKYAAVTEDELKTLVEEAMKEDHYDFIDKFRPDLDVEFDYENHELVAIEKINDFVFAVFSSGGDWEYPVIWIAYYDGVRLRAYVPKNGNLFNSITKYAYGNDVNDIKDLIKRGIISREATKHSIDKNVVELLESLFGSNHYKMYSSEIKEDIKAKFGLK